MPFLLIVLLLANVALFLYVRSGDAPPAPPPPVAAESIVLLRSLSESEAVPTAPAPTPAPEPALTTVCLEWGPFTETQLDNARAVLNRVPQLGSYQEIQRQSAVRTWLVSVDGFDSRAIAVNRANELRRQGVSDISVLEPGAETDSSFALSLGVFSSEQGAQSRVASLNEMRITGIKITPRGSSSSTSFLITDASPALERHLRELPPRFTDSTVQRVACPPQRN